MSVLKIGLIGDIVGRAGRNMVVDNLSEIRKKYKLDFVIANAENASGGFGLNIKNANELLSAGIDLITGGNHSFDKMEITAVMGRDLESSVDSVCKNGLDSSVEFVESKVKSSTDSAKIAESSPKSQDSSPDSPTFQMFNLSQNLTKSSFIMPILRPLNFPPKTPGSGICCINLGGEKIAVINIMGHYGINMNLDNAFYKLQNAVSAVKKLGFDNIIIDFHGEASSEKRAAFCMLRGEISAFFGTHTHIGSDDLHIQNGSFYVSDLGLCGAFDGVIGMDYKAPLQKAMSGFGKSRYEVANSNNNILQMVILTLENAKCVEAFKLRILNNKELDIINAIRL
ncbi:hypothetical protein CCY99_04425 [Helicobacter sp. 16-1353]|uniref:TIGR00282 family metallophosphoesterase n=1 Tax=Helicobacter sp. 16-1353 TaxID=2004996 RepID=UPI000DCB1E7A|nr:TIGR00282 family metallophosphoesterase [Helicobacter sp. 16-1353]RAX54262.1 hypothetical protein CCY99_04425 [Helicobacter sp. 16-1353]